MHTVDVTVLVELLKKSVLRIFGRTVGIALHPQATLFGQLTTECRQLPLVVVVEIALGVCRETRRGIKWTIGRVEIEEGQPACIMKGLREVTLTDFYVCRLEQLAVGTYHLGIANGGVCIVPKGYIKAPFGIHPIETVEAGFVQ